MLSSVAQHLFKFSYHIESYFPACILAPVISHLALCCIIKFLLSQNNCLLCITWQLFICTSFLILYLSPHFWLFFSPGYFNLFFITLCVFLFEFPLVCTVFITYQCAILSAFFSSAYMLAFCHDFLFHNEFSSSLMTSKVLLFTFTYAFAFIYHLSFRILLFLVLI